MHFLSNIKFVKIIEFLIYSSTDIIDYDSIYLKKIMSLIYIIWIKLYYNSCNIDQRRLHQRLKHASIKIYQNVETWTSSKEKNDWEYHV